MVLDPSNEFNVDRTLTRDDVQKLIRASIPFAKPCVSIQKGYVKKELIYVEFNTLLDTR